MTPEDKAYIVELAKTAEHFSRSLRREVDVCNFMNADWCQQVAESAAIQAFNVANGVS